MTGYVYAMAADNGLVKIGYSADPRRRLTKINSDAGSPCKLAGFIEATREQERELQRLLVTYRQYSEWFRNEGLVAHFVGMLPIIQVPKYKGRRRKMPEAAAHPLSEFREQQGLTLAELARRLRVARNTVWRWENGRQVDRRFWHRIHDETGIPLESLAGLDSGVAA